VKDKSFTQKNCEASTMVLAPCSSRLFLDALLGHHVGLAEKINLSH